MRHKKQWAGFLALTAVFLIALSPRAYAYLDPGSTGFFVQMLLAALVGLSFTLKAYWKKIKGFFSGKKDPPAKS